MLYPFTRSIACDDITSNILQEWLEKIRNNIHPKGDAIRTQKIQQYKREKQSKQKMEVFHISLTEFDDDNH